MIYLYVVGTEPPQGFTGDDAEQQVVFIHSAAEFELLELTGAERDAGPAVPIELGQQICDDVFLVVALDNHAVDAGSKRTEIRGQCNPGGHELIQGYFPQTVDNWFRIITGAVGRAVHLFGQVQSVRNRILHQCPAAQRRARQQYRPAEQT